MLYSIVALVSDDVGDDGHSGLQRTMNVWRNGPGLHAVHMVTEYLFSENKILNQIEINI